MGGAKSAGGKSDGGDGDGPLIKYVNNGKEQRTKDEERLKVSTHSSLHSSPLYNIQLDSLNWNPVNRK